MRLLDEWNKQPFSIYTSEEKGVLGLLKRLGIWVGKIIAKSDEIEAIAKDNQNKKVSFDDMKNKYKMDKNFNENECNYTGSWYGIKRPEYAEPGIQGQVTANREELEGARFGEKTLGKIINKILNWLIDVPISIEFFEIDNTGTNDVTEKLQEIISKYKKVYFPKGKYLITSTLICDENTLLKGHQATIFTNENIKMVEINSNSEINGITFESDKEVYTSGSVGIYSQGENYTKKKTNIVIKNCKFYNIGFEGISLYFTDYVDIINCYMDKIGYAGVGCKSASYINVNKSVIKDLGSGSNFHSYGVYFSREESDDIIAFPPSSNCIVKNCIIKNNPLWEGLDTHGGVNIIFKNNIIENCKSGIVITNSDNGSQVETFPPSNCKVINNYIEGINTGYGINLQGNATNSSLNNIIEGNILKKCGANKNTINGALGITGYTIGCIVKNNTLIQSAPNGIIVTGAQNKDFLIEGNTVIDTFDTTTITNGIIVRTSDNKGKIKNNSLINTKTLSYEHLCERGISISSGTTNNSILISDNSNEYTTPYTGLNKDNSISSILNNNVKIICGNGEPENNVIASIGSLYIRTNGSSNTTLYVKESGADATGWVAK